MINAKIALLPDRGVLSVTGADARTFLDSIITNDMALLDTRGAIFAGLLSPQGKILFDFIVVKVGDGFLLDVAMDQAGGLVNRLTMYRLRAKVEIARQPTLCCLARWPFSASSVVPVGDIAFWADPRSSGLGERGFWSGGVPSSRPNTMIADYHAHRIALGIPEGGRDYAFGEAFPHEALFDQLGGVSFTKGCYVGQEIVARMEHRGTARRRIVRVRGDLDLPPAGTDILAGDVAIGSMGSSAGTAGLAMLRVDRAVEFQGKGVALTVGGVGVVPDATDIARLMPKAPHPIALG